ncbi:MAG TPA: hypothetical protein VIM89_04765 [Mucilaginibacter sp.]
MAAHTVDFYFHSRKVSLILLAVTAFIFSRILFVFFHDAEGPNPVVITGFVSVVYVSSILAYLFVPLRIRGVIRLSATIVIQLLAVIALYILMK